MTDKQYSAHEWLNEALWIEKTELKIKREYAEKIKPDDGAMDYSKDRVQNNSSGAQEDRLLTYTMACQAVEAIEKKIEDIKRIRQAMIDSLESSEYRSILTARYLLRMKPEDIAREMNYSERQFYRKRNRALDLVYDKIKEVDDG